MKLLAHLEYLVLLTVLGMVFAAGYAGTSTDPPATHIEGGTR